MYNILNMIPVLLSLMVQPVHLICSRIQLFSHSIQLSIEVIYCWTQKNGNLRSIHIHKTEYWYPSNYEGNLFLKTVPKVKIHKLKMKFPLFDL